MPLSYYSNPNLFDSLEYPKIDKPFEERLGHPVTTAEIQDQLNPGKMENLQGLMAIQLNYTRHTPLY